MGPFVLVGTDPEDFSPFFFSHDRVLFSSFPFGFFF